MSLFCNYTWIKGFSYTAFLICRLNFNVFESWEIVKIKISIGPSLVLLFLFWNRSKAHSVPFTSEILVKTFVSLQSHESQNLSLSFGQRPECNPFICSDDSTFSSQRSLVRDFRPCGDSTQFVTSSSVNQLEANEPCHRESIDFAVFPKTEVIFLFRTKGLLQSPLERRSPNVFTFLVQVCSGPCFCSGETQDQTFRADILCGLPLKSGKGK